MEITFLGHSSFKLRGKTATVVTDPFSPEMVGLKFPKVQAEIVTVSHGHQDHNQTSLVAGQPFVVNNPGEYEVKGVSLFGIASFHDSTGGSQRGKNTIFLMEMDGLRICHLGDLGHKLTSLQLEELNGVDILLLPIGGTYTLGSEEAVEVVFQLEPKIVIPMHYQMAGLNPAVFAELTGVEEFLKKTGVEKMSLPKLQVSKDKLPEERQIIILEPKNG